MKQENNFNVDFKDMLSDKQELNKIFNHIGQDQYEIGEILSTYEKDDNRQGAIIMVQDNKIDELQKIIIDAIYGEPNSTQVKDVTYDQGAECDKRIILYTLENPGYTKNEYRHEHEMAEGFVKINNDCGCDTFVVEVSLDSDKTYKYNIEMFPDGKKWTSFKKLPAKLEFEKAVFKVFYNQTDWYEGYEHVEHMEDIAGWFDGTYWCLDIHGIEYIYPVWTEEGMFAQAVSISDEGKTKLKSIKENNLKNLEKMFVNREITFEKGLAENITMSIKLWDKPFSFFTKASPEDKEKTAEFLRKFDHQISEYWDHRHYLKGPENKVVKEHLAIPKDAFNELEQEISA